MLVISRVEMKMLNLEVDKRMTISPLNFYQIFDEADLDDDSQLSFAEFEHVISKAPDFVK